MAHQRAGEAREKGKSCARVALVRAAGVVWVRGMWLRMISLLSGPVLVAAQEAAVSPEPGVFSQGAQCGQVAGMAADDSGRVWLSVTGRSHGRGVFACTTDQMHRDDLSVFSLSDRRACLTRWKTEGLLPAMTLETPPGTGSLTANSESVVCLTDDDADGTADTRRVFAEEFSDPLDGPAAGLLPLGGNAVLFACTPSLWRMEDDNGDGRADRRLPLLTGLGLRTGDGLAGIAALTEGPDGRIYFTTGDRGCRITGSDSRRVLLEDTGGVFRCAPDGTGLELLASGLRAPAGIVVDLRGRVFVADAGPEQTSRLLQILPGADCGWDAAIPGRGVFAAGERPAWMLPEIALLPVRATGLVMEPPGDAPVTRLLLSEGEKSGSLLPVEITENLAGATARAAEPRWRGAAACAPVFLPDGTLLWAEWQGGFGGASACRILRQPPPAQAGWTEGAALLRKGLDSYPPRELAQLMEHAHPLVRLRARQALAARGFTDSLEVFTRIARRSPSIPARLNALWGLAQLGRDQPMLLNEAVLLLASTEPAVRALAVQILGESGYSGPPQDILALLRDPAPEVRAAAAIAAGRSQPAGALPALLAVLPALDPADPVLRQAYTFALMRLASAETLASYATAGDIPPPVRQCALHALCRMRSSRAAAFLTGGNLDLAAAAALAVYDQRILPAFPALSALLENAATQSALQSPQIILRALAAAQYLGTAADAARVAAFAALPVEESLRLRALETLAAWDTPPEFDPLHGRRALPIPRDPGLARSHLQTLLATPPAGFSEPTAARVATIAAQINARPAADQLIAAVKTTSLPDAARIDALQRLATLQPAAALSLARSLLPDSANPVRPAAPKPGNPSRIVTPPQPPPQPLGTAPPRGTTPRLRAAARTLIMRHDAGAAYAQIHDALANGSSQEMQATLLTAQRFDSRQSEAFWLETGRNLYYGKVPGPARIEVMEALIQRDKEPRSKWRRLLEVIEADFPDESDPLARYRQCETGGDPDKGRLIFETSLASCLDCHSHGGRGGTTGPELDGIGQRRLAPALLSSLLQPSAAIAPGYARVTATLASGAQPRGILRRHSATIDLETPATLLRLPPAEVKGLTQPESPMPPASGLLTPRELRDLIAYLATL